MSVKSRLVGKNNSPLETHTTDKYGEASLVYTVERQEKSFTTLPLLNPTYGLAMNQNAAFGGTPVLVHDGVDTVAWTATNVAGSKMTANSTDEFHGGAASVKVANPSLNDVWQFDKGSTIDLSSYVAITMFVYVEKDWTAGDDVSFYAWDTSGGAQVGDAVDLDFYFSENTFGEWQSVIIPLSDMSIESDTIDSFRMEQTGKSGPAATWYIDDFQIEETGSTIDFTVAPAVNQMFHVTQISNYFVNDVTEAVMQDYDKFYGETALTNGLLAVVQSGGVQFPSLSVTVQSDMMPFPQTNALEVIPGSTHTQCKLVTNFDLSFDGSKGDFFTYRVQDDLTGLTKMETWMFGWMEEI